MQKIVVVVPCYNEERRLQPRSLLTLLQDHRFHLLLVDDGSNDATPQLLASLARERPDRIEVLRLPHNSGKAEAVRRGLLAALAGGAIVVGYLDADLATPPEEMHRMFEEMRTTGARVVIGARVRLLGRTIERQEVRHYLGRVFATFASWALRLPVYDTQCGAKLLEDGDALRSALARPFRSKWAFDVELFERLLVAPVNPLREEHFLEVPLLVWRDKPGSKLGAPAMLKAGVDLLGIALARRKVPLSEDE